MAKSILLLFCFLSVPGYCFGQFPKKGPFQVIAVDSASSTRKSALVQPLDFLHTNDTLTVHSGLLLLGHSSGRILGFEGDTTLFMKDLAPHLTNAWEHDESRGYFWLFEEKRPTLPTGSVTAGMPPEIEWVFPLALNGGFKAQQVTHSEACLVWKDRGQPSQPESYQVHILNIFEEGLDTLEVSGFQVTIPLDDYSDIEYQALLFRVVETGTETYPRASQLGILKLLPSGKPFATPCNISTATSALELACYFEKNGNVKEAQRYFERSLDLSEHSIYSQILTLFHKRWSI